MSNNITTKTGFEDYEDGEDWHVYPVGDSREHVTDRKHDCFCEPKVILEETGRIFMHDALDGRE